jgi:hypothetical protein
MLLRLARPWAGCLDSVATILFAFVSDRLDFVG